MKKFVPIYTTYDNVKVRLANKVQFQSGRVAQDGELPDLLLGQLISDAEAKVEQDLRSRYAIPVRSKRTGLFKDLPDHSQRAIRRAVDMAATCEVLRTDFGRGTHIDADKYTASLEKEYQAYIKVLMGHDNEGKERERYRFAPPLEDVLLAVTNREADDGYKGAIINTDARTGDAVSYAEDQINDPSKSYISSKRGGIIL